MYHYGAKSESRLITGTPGIVAVFREVIKHVDVAILEVSRTDALQAQYFAEGKSTLDGVKQLSKHQVTVEDPLSRAIDAIPYPTTLNGVNIWADTFRFTLFAGEVIATGWSLGVLIRWGGDWDGDGSNADQKFHDLPHFEEN